MVFEVYSRIRSPERLDKSKCRYTNVCFLNELLTIFCCVCVPGRVGRWWQKVVLTTGFYRLKPAGKKCGWQKVAKNKINFIIKSFLIRV